MTPETILSGIQDRINEWEQAAIKSAEVEADFKSWCAATKKALIDSNKSAAQAEAMVTAMDGWSERYINAQTWQIREKKLKYQIEQGVRHWETWRSENSMNRRAVG